LAGWPATAGISSFKKKEEKTDWDTGAIVSLVCAAIFLVFIFAANSHSYYCQLDDFESLKMYQRIEKVYEEKAISLTTQFASYLAEAYPQHEKEIFKSINPGTVSLFMVKYPELQASKTLLSLVGQISALQTDRYSQRVEFEKTLKEVRFRPKSPFVISWLIPTLPPDLAPIAAEAK